MEQNRDEEIDKLKRLLFELETKNSNLYYELKALKTKIENLSSNEEITKISNETKIKIDPIIPVQEIKKEEIANLNKELNQNSIQKPTFREEIKTPLNQTTHLKQTKNKQDWERFIGENLISKIGILITIIGVAIGSKYAIDHQLISPLMRIILGYVLGSGLLLFALKLKTKYLDFSSVLLSGSMAIFYFLTYISFSFYHFFSTEITFVLMLIFTSFTVFASLQYNRQIIAHLGLIGAYATPFLLSDGSGKVAFFYSYIAIVNIGILVISFLRNWKSLIYVSLGFTWGIFLIWYVFSYTQTKHFNLAIIFSLIYFMIFYVSGLAYKVIRHEKFSVMDVFLILVNSFIFFGFGYNIIASHGELDQYLGLFTLTNAVIHFIVALILFKNKLVDKTVFYLTCALVLIFVTITIPIQFDGNAVTLTWSFEALMLFLVGRTKKVALFEHMSYPIFILGFISLITFWIRTYGPMTYLNKYANDLFETNDINFLFNYKFLTSFCFLISASIIYFISNSKNQNLNLLKQVESNYALNKSFNSIFQVFLILILIISTYMTFFLEINQFWINKFEIHHNKPYLGIIHSFSILSYLIYSFVFVASILFYRNNKINSSEFNIFSFIVASILIMIYLFIGLYEQSYLQLKYIHSQHTFFSPIFLVLVRYFTYTLFGSFIFIYYKFYSNQFKEKGIKVFLEFLIHVILVWILSAELVNWMHLFNSRQVYKLGLSIFWGIYALSLVSYGIWKKKSHLRIGAISLFGVTLIKLFIYDLSHMTTISKTIVFIALGIILLIISFLYNKYKNVLFDDSEN